MKRFALRLALDVLVGGACLAVGALALGAIILTAPTADGRW